MKTPSFLTNSPISHSKVKHPICPHCGKESVAVTGRDIYPHLHELYDKVFYQCKPCDAYIGCHPGTNKPLGGLANAELRKARTEAHRVFDPMWRSRKMTRRQAYDWLSKKIGLKIDECHVGMFDVKMCERVIQVCRGRNRI